jgi:hypothetical protein
VLPAESDRETEMVYVRNFSCLKDGRISFGGVLALLCMPFEFVGT